MNRRVSITLSPEAHSVLVQLSRHSQQRMISLVDTAVMALMDKTLDEIDREMSQATYFMAKIKLGHEINFPLVKYVPK